MTCRSGGLGEQYATVLEALLVPTELRHILSLLSSTDATLRGRALALLRQILTDSRLGTADGVRVANALLSRFFGTMAETSATPEAEAQLQQLLDLRKRSYSVGSLQEAWGEAKRV